MANAIEPGVETILRWVDLAIISTELWQLSSGHRLFDRHCQDSAVVSREDLNTCGQTACGVLPRDSVSATPATGVDQPVSRRLFGLSQKTT